jgi:hypothetical protein
MLLFQLTMPVTLAATMALLPGRAGFAFGLTCLALVAGALPTHLWPRAPVLADPALVASLLLASTVALFIGLRLVDERRQLPSAADSASRVAS